MAEDRLSENRFWRDETGQDLTEYALLLAFVCLGSAAMFLNEGNSVAGIWKFGNNLISNANKAAGS
jgi:Flp pilus assembly pilin Flp